MGDMGAIQVQLRRSTALADARRRRPDPSAPALVRTGATPAAKSATIKAPTGPVESHELVAYLTKLQPYVDAMQSDVVKHTYNVSDPSVAKVISLGRDDGATDQEIEDETNLVKTWKGWGFMKSGTDEPEHPGFYRGWEDMDEYVRSGTGRYTRLWPWLVFGPYAGILLVPAVVAAAGTSAASNRGEIWNNIRDAHLRLRAIRKDLSDLGYKPSGGPLPDVPASVGALGIGILGDDGGEGKARAWYEDIPWEWLIAGVVLIGGAMLLKEVSGVAKAVSA
jgi:hypothetical protein